MTPKGEQTLLPLASNQIDIWQDQRIYPQSPHFNIGGNLHVCGEIDPKILEQAVRQLINESDSLRMQLHEENRVPFLFIAAEKPPVLEFINFATNADPLADAIAWVEQTFRKPFYPLQHRFLYQYALVRISESEHLMVGRYHHLISDGLSSKLANDRINHLYNALLNKQAPAASNPATFEEYIDSNQEYTQSNRYQKDAQFWQEYLPQLPDILFPQRPQSALLTEQLPRAFQHRFTLNRDLYNRLTELAEAHQGTTYHLLLCVLTIYLCRVYQRSEILYGVPSLNRKGRFKQILGMFISLSPLNIELNEEESFIDLIQNVSKQLRLIYRHQRFPLGEILKQYKLIQHQRNTLFEVVVSYEKQEISNLYGEATIKGHQRFSGVARYPLAVTICEFQQHEDVEIVLEGSEACFSEEELALVSTRLHTLFQQISESPEQAVAELNPLPQAELEKIYPYLINRLPTYPFRDLISRFRDQVKRAPEHLAIICQQQQMSYRELDHASTCVARHLLKLGLGANQICAICTPRSPEMVIAMLAILKCGAAYLPINPDVSLPRIRTQLKLSGSRYLLTIKAITAEFSDLAVNTIAIDLFQNLCAPQTEIGHRPAANDLAYLLFTSGSTGEPKGVMIEHGALSQRIDALQDHFQLTPDDRVGQSIAYNFDPSIIDTLFPLTQGSTLILFPPHQLDGSSMATFIRDMEISTLALVPSSLRLICKGMQSMGLKASPLRHVCCGGEPLTPELAEEFSQRTGASLFNFYGPTEATIFATSQTYEDHFKKQPLPLGKAIQATAIFIVDQKRRPLPSGIIGEIAIAGAGLARGYFNTPEQTERSFSALSSPNTPADSARIYLTGDMGYLDSQGRLYFSGRSDRQIKISGYRIELEEIELQISVHPQIALCAVSTFHESGNTRILAYLQLKERSTDQSVLKKEISRRLTMQLPDYMQPYRYIFINEIGRTTNGKIDYAALPQPKSEDLQPQTLHKKQLSGNPYEAEIYEIWSKCLGATKIGVEDNFFEIGGDSLAAVNLIHSIESFTGYRHSISFLLNHPTIGSQAAALEEEMNGESRPVLTTLSRHGTGTPFYLLASGRGDVMRFINLAEKLGETWTLHMLQPPMQHHSELTMEEIGEIYAKTIIEHLNGQQPFYLGGFSIGGVSALETMRILLEQDQTPETLLLLDSVYPSRPMRSPLFNRLLNRMSKINLLKKMVINGRRLEVMLADPGIRVQLKALESYSPRDFNHLSTLLICSKNMRFKRFLYGGWQNLFTDGLKTVEVNGLHGSMFQDPYVDELAMAINRYKADSETEST